MVQKHFSKVSSSVSHSHCRKDENATIANCLDKRARWSVRRVAHILTIHRVNRSAVGQSVFITALLNISTMDHSYVCMHHRHRMCALQFPFVRPGDELAGLKTTLVAK